MRISDWSSDVCSSDLGDWRPDIEVFGTNSIRTRSEIEGRFKWYVAGMTPCGREGTKVFFSVATTKDEKSEEYFDKWQAMHNRFINEDLPILNRSEEHTSELQSLMRISYAVFCLKKKKQQQHEVNTKTN